VVLKIAMRNMWRQKRRTILTSLTMVGGFLLAAVSIGWSDGTYSYIINMFTGDRLGHVQVHAAGYLDEPSIYARIRDYGRVGSAVAGVPGVRAWAPRVYAAGLASFGEKTSAVRINGLDPELEHAATGFFRKVFDGRPLSGAPRQALLGRGLARILGTAPGDAVVVLSQAADGSMANDLFDVAGIVDTGDEAADRMDLYLNLGAAQEFLSIGGDVHEIAVLVDDLKGVGRVTEAIRAELGDAELEVLPWQQVARSFYDAMQADRQGMWIMLGIIILIVAVGVLNTVLMSVLERRREYGLLLAVGTRPGTIVSLVLGELLGIVLVSVAAGALLSVAVNWILSIHGIPMPMSLSFGGVTFDRMYSEVNLRSLVIPAATVAAAAMAVGIFPACNAARTEPARAMRTF